MCQIKVKRTLFAESQTGSDSSDLCHSGPAFKRVALLPWDIEYERTGLYSRKTLNFSMTIGTPKP
uniref:Uncharacterized protein n=1 Tax=Romanomermis culicivorax TaxID=13658 RepID=A0A915J623_ROMCU